MTTTENYCYYDGHRDDPYLRPPSRFRTQEWLYDPDTPTTSGGNAQCTSVASPTARRLQSTFFFANQKQQKDGTVHIERGDSSLIIYTVYINILDEGGEIQLDLRSQKKTE